jgi:lysine 6-dehydrogenase
MTRIVVLGAGIVGRAAAWDLLRRGYDVLVADSDPAAAEGLAAELDLDWQHADASLPDSLSPLLGGADLVISAVPYRLGLGVAAAAVDAGVHYLDFGGNPTVVASQLGLDEEARRAGVAVVPDCGLAPGLANVLAEADIAAVGPGTIDRVALRVGALPEEPVGVLGYQLAFSPEGLVNEYAEQCEVLRDGSHATVEPLTEFEEVDWAGWGPLEAFHTAGGSSSLARRWHGRVSHLDYKTLRYPGHGRVFRALFELGMFEETPRDLEGGRVSRRAVLLEALGSRLPAGSPDVVLVRTWAEATRSGTRRVAGHQLVDRHDGRFSALARTTAFPATALAHLILQGRDAGACTMDAAVTADDLLPELAPVGIVPESWPS